MEKLGSGRFSGEEFALFVNREEMVNMACLFDDRVGIVTKFGKIAGIQSGQIMAERCIKAVLTGNVGPNAFQALSVAKIKIITGESGTIKEAIKNFNDGRYKAIESATVAFHSGMDPRNNPNSMRNG